MEFKTLHVRYQGTVCFIRLHRPEADNAINDQLVEELGCVLDQCEEEVTVVVLEGLPHVFCMGADFQEIHAHMAEGRSIRSNPEPLYALWMRMRTGPYIVLSHVKGKANAGGLGFIAASDIVLADGTAQFSLSELLFGLYPACVMPFLIQKTGMQRAHYMTLMTQAFDAETALRWGLIDAWEPDSESLLRRHLLRLKRLPKAGIAKYKRYMNELQPLIREGRELAITANQTMFADPDTLSVIYNFVNKGQFPWEG